MLAALPQLGQCCSMKDCERGAYWTFSSLLLPPSSLLPHPSSLTITLLSSPFLLHPSPLHLHKRCSHASLLMGHKNPVNRTTSLPNGHQGHESFPFPPLAWARASVSQEHGVILQALFSRAETHSNFLSPGSLGKMAAKCRVPTSPILLCLKLGKKCKGEEPSACHPPPLSRTPPG